LETKEKKSKPLVTLLYILLIISILMNIGSYRDKYIERQWLNDNICHLLYRAIWSIDGYFENPDDLSSIEEAGLYIKKLQFTFESNNGISPINTLELSIAGNYLLLQHNRSQNSILSDGIISESEEEFLRQLSVMLNKLLARIISEDSLSVDNPYIRGRNLSYEQINSILYEFELDFTGNDFLMNAIIEPGIWELNEFDFESEWYLDATKKPNQNAGGGGVRRSQP